MAQRLARIIPIAIRNRDAFARLVKRDVADRYLATRMGLAWAILEPASFIALLWLIFSHFRTTPTGEAPFLLYLATGYAAWLYASGTISQTTNVIRQYAFLVTKVSFPVWLLPFVKLVSQLCLHWVFLVLVFVLLLYYGYFPKFSWLQLIYLQFAAAYLALGLSLLTSALNVFYKDVQEIVSIVFRFGFWLTPVFWSIDLLPEEMRGWIGLNPFFYLVEGYRQVLLYDQSVLQLENTLWFWGFSTVALILGSVFFIRLRPYFAEIL